MMLHGKAEPKSGKADYHEEAPPAGNRWRLGEAGVNTALTEELLFEMSGIPPEVKQREVWKNVEFRNFEIGENIKARDIPG